MPESPEDTAFMKKFKKDKRDYERRKKRVMSGKLEFCRFRRSDSNENVGRLAIHPHSFALGTKRKKYCSFKVDRTQYSDSTEPCTDEPIPIWHQERLKEPQYKPCSYLLEKELKVAPIVIARRGKLLAFGAGHHLMVIHWGLEGHVVRIPIEEYLEIISASVAGPNKNRTKASKLRDYELPERFTALFSKEEDDIRRLRMFAAVVGEEYAWVILDFARLVRIHVHSRDNEWTQEDLQPGSAVWESLWVPFNGGPDWNDEPELALSGLNHLRTLVNADPDKLGSQSVLQIMSPAATSSVESDEALSTRVFANQGRHLNNDGLHACELFPGMPASLVFAEPQLITAAVVDPDIAVPESNLFERLRDGLFEYLRVFDSKKFEEDVCIRTCDSNFLAYSSSAADTYATKYMKVFRKAFVTISVEKYERLMRAGLLDPTHTIGAAYVPNAFAIIPQLHQQQEIRVPVWKRRGKEEFYTIIRAQAPENEGWDDGPELPARDHRLDGYSTTIGVEEFHNIKKNKIDAYSALAAKEKSKGGRPPKRKGGQATQHEDLTIAKLRKIINREENIEKTDQQIRTKFVNMYPVRPPSPPPMNKLPNSSNHKEIAGSLATPEVASVNSELSARGTRYALRGQGKRPADNSPENSGNERKRRRKN